MKIKPKQYAIGLSESEEKEQKEVIKNFVAMLIANNDISKLEAIFGYFGDLWDKREGIMEVEIISCHDLDEDIVGAFKEAISQKTGVKKIMITTKKDKKLLGGVILRYGDRSLDMSLRKRLDEFKYLISN